MGVDYGFKVESVHGTDRMYSIYAYFFTFPFDILSEAISLAFYVNLILIRDFSAFKKLIIDFERHVTLHMDNIFTQTNRVTCD